MSRSGDRIAVVPCLASRGPHADLAPEHRLFAPLIGSWDLDVEWLDHGGVVRTAKGEWHFSWVLEGRAIQDVWIVPSIAEREAGQSPYEYGTSVRFHDPDIGGWRSIWIGPTRRSIEIFVARQVDRDVVLETRRVDGRVMKWVFSEIGEDSFVWRNWLQDGSDWDLTQRFCARRRSV